MDKKFNKIYSFLSGKKLLFVGFLLLLLSFLVFFSVKLNFEEDISKVIPQSEESVILNKVIANTNFSDNIILNIQLQESGNLDNLSAFADDIVDSLNQYCSPFISKIQGKVSDKKIQETIDFIYDNLPLFLDQKDYDFIDTQLEVDSIKKQIEENYKTLISPGGIVTKKMIRKDPFGLTWRALKKLENLKISDDFEMFNAYLTTNNKQNILLFIKPKLPTNETDKNTVFVNELNRISKQLNLKYKDKVIGEFYGSTIIAVGNANQIKTDIKYTVSVAMIILFLVLIFFYKKVWIPFLVFLPTLFGALSALVFLYFFREKISAISIGIGSVLLGITVDYSLHILTHFRKNNNVKKLYTDVTKPILMSSLTTAIAFLCLLFLKSQALQDLGIFAAVSVFSTSVFALIIIPIFYKPKAVLSKESENFIEKIAGYAFSKNKVLVLIIVGLFIIGLFNVKNVSFNKDLNQMNYQNSTLLKAEKNLDNILNLSSKSVYVVAYGENLEEVLKTNTKINTLLNEELDKNNVIRFSSNGSLVNSKEEQLTKLNNWNSFWTDARKKRLKSNLIEEGKRFDFKESTFKPFYHLLDNNFSALDLAAFSNSDSFFVDEYISTKGDLKTAVSLVKINKNKKEVLKKVFEKIPNVILIDRQEISETFLGGLKDNFSTLINYSFIAVILVLFLFYKNVELTLFTVLPIAITWVITLGIMHFFNIEFTIFNVIISTFIFGLGVDYSIFMTNGLVKDYTYGTKTLSTYRVSIILSLITTILGVGVLIFAKHPALKSISSLSLIGIFITVIVAFTIQPFLFQVIVNKRVNKGFSPLKFRQFLHSVVLLIFYGLGGMILSLFSLIFLPLIPLSKKVKNKWLHNTAAKLVTAVLYTNPFVKKKIINTNKEDFKKPVIVISNHASALDTLTLGMLTPKLVYLVNDWVYKSPVFGILARVLGFYPVSNGVDDSLDHLKKKVEQGYSLMVFPEGKRSFTNKMGRFHKGASFLQEQLKLDILPVYLHGNAEVMPKNDFIIHDGSLTVQVGKRIKYSDKDFGDTIKERTKAISKYFKSEYVELRNTIENQDYFKNILYSNYWYKDKNIQIKVHDDFDKNKKIYQELNEKLPMQSKILHIGNDLGQIDILLISKSIERKINSFISNKNHLKVAKNCYTVKSRKVTYLENISAFKTDGCHLLLITDASGLKYLNQIDLLAFKEVFVLNKTFSEVKIIKNEDINISIISDLFK